MQTLKQQVLPGFPPPPDFTEILREVYGKPLMEFLRADMNRMAFGVTTRPPYEVQQLFTPTRTCDQYWWGDDDSFDCGLDMGHSGPHRDFSHRIEWKRF